MWQSDFSGQRVKEGERERSAMHQKKKASKKENNAGTEEDGGWDSRFHPRLPTTTSLSDEGRGASFTYVSVCSGCEFGKKSMSFEKKKRVGGGCKSQEGPAPSLIKKQTRLHLPAVWKQDPSRFILFIKIPGWHITDCMLPWKCRLSPQDGIESVTTYGKFKEHTR